MVAFCTKGQPCWIRSCGLFPRYSHQTSPFTGFLWIWFYLWTRDQALTSCRNLSHRIRRLEKPFSNNLISQFSSPVGLSTIALISPLGWRSVWLTGTPVVSAWQDAHTRRACSWQSCSSGPERLRENSYVSATNKAKPGGEKTINKATVLILPKWKTAVSEGNVGYSSVARRLYGNLPPAWFLSRGSVFMREKETRDKPSDKPGRVYLREEQRGGRVKERSTKKSKQFCRRNTPKVAEWNNHSAPHERIIWNLVMVIPQKISEESNMIPALF